MIGKSHTGIRQGDFNNNCFVCVFMLCSNNELIWETKNTKNTIKPNENEMQIRVKVAN